MRVTSALRTPLSENYATKILKIRINVTMEESKIIKKFKIGF